MISIVILNYNGWRDTVECLESVFNSDCDAYRIVIVDNDSSDDSYEQLGQWITGTGNNRKKPYLEKEFTTQIDTERFGGGFCGLIKGVEWQAEDNPKITLLKAPRNGGYAYGNNLGIMYSLRYKDVDALWMLNNDTVVLEDTLTNLMGCYIDIGIEKNNVFLVGSVQLYYDNREKVQAYAGKFDKWRGKFTNIGANEMYKEYIFDNRFDFVYGASMIVSRECIEKVGLLSEDYFIYYEEIDYAQRIRKYGYKMLICKEAIVLHKHSATIAKQDKSYSSTFYYNNMIIFYRKHYPLLLFVPFIKVISNLFIYGFRSWSDARFYLGVLKYYIAYLFAH